MTFTLIPTSTCTRYPPNGQQNVQNQLSSRLPTSRSKQQNPPHVSRSHNKPNVEDKTFVERQHIATDSRSGRSTPSGDILPPVTRNNRKNAEGPFPHSTSVQRRGGRHQYTAGDGSHEPLLGRQPRATASIHQFSDEEDPVPLKPPIPVPHPSEDVRAYPRPTSSHAAVPIRSKPDPTTKSAIAPTYTKADPTIQSKSAPMISKAIRKKTGAGGLVRAAPNPLDPFLIVDPNLRGKLGIQPQTNSKLIRSAVRPNKAVVSHSRFVEASAATVPVVLDHPAPNSLKLLKQHIKTIKDSKFNPVEAIAKLMVEDEDTIKQVHGRVTAKALNVDRTALQYQNLTAVNTHFMHTHDRKSRSEADKAPAAESSAGEPVVTQVENAFLPASQLRHRAKKSVSKAYLSTRSPAPPVQQQDVEMETIAIPYPQLEDNPFAVGSGATGVRMGSIEANMEDWWRWRGRMAPIRPEDFDPE